MTNNEILINNFNSRGKEERILEIQEKPQSVIWTLKRLNKKIFKKT